MPYTSLTKIYYKSPKTYEATYLSRFNNEFTKHLPFTIKQFNRENENPVFFCYTEEISNLQDKIMSECSSFYKILEEIPTAGISQFLYTSLIEEIKSSNDIEGVHSTRKEIKVALSSHEKVRLSGIVNKYKKIINNEMISLHNSKDIRNLFDDFLYDEIEADNPANLPDGTFFRSGSVDVVSETQKTLHRGIYPETKIIKYMDDSLLMLRDSMLPVFIRIAIFHYLFGYIHPFYDGNGRMSRFITSYLLSKELHPTLGLQVSILLKKNRKTYYTLFQEADSDINKGDLTPFIIGTLKFIYTAIIHTKTILQKKLNQYHYHKQNLSVFEINDSTTFKVYDILLQASVFSTWGITVDEMIHVIEKTESTIYSRLKAIPNDRIIISKNSRPYHYRLNLNSLKQK